MKYSLFNGFAIFLFYLLRTVTILYVHCYNTVQIVYHVAEEIIHWDQAVGFPFKF